MIELLPEKYDQLGLSPNEKSFIKVVERAFIKDETHAYFVLQINPRKRGLDDDQAAPELFNLLIFQDGIILFRLFDTVEADIATKIINVFCQYKLFDELNIDIAERLKCSRYLTDNSGELKYPFSIKLVFPNIKKAVMLNANNDFILTHCLFDEDLQSLRHDGKNAFSSMLSKKEKIVEDVVNNIFQRLCPEITIPRKFFLDEHQKIAGMDGVVTLNERSVQAYRLEAGQINFINKIGKGNQLILACAGSGKSVLLISKCFKLSSLNPAEKFLITCYNKNLRDYYNWTREQAGFSDNGQIEVKTIFELCSQLLKANGIALPPKQESAEEYFRLLFYKAAEALRVGQIKQRFYGVFIDEIQIFEPEWYKFCYNLLKSKNEEDHFFVIAGDKSQDIKQKSKKGFAPWQGHGVMYPKYSSRTYAIETNYRNSKPINAAIDKFVELAKAKGAKFGADLTSDPECFLRGIAYREGDAPVIIENDDYSNKGEVDSIVKEIKYLIESKEFSETDIAVIFYNKTGRADETWKNRSYSFEQPLKDAFYKEGWNPPAMLFGENDRSTYGRRRGITIATIEGALGLDYRAVILAGLHPLGKRDSAKSDSDFAENNDDFITELAAEGKVKAFMQNVNCIYTGCTRAKDSLSIVLSIESGKCVYSDLLREAIGGRR